MHADSAGCRLPSEVHHHRQICRGLTHTGANEQPFRKSADVRIAVWFSNSRAPSFLVYYSFFSKPPQQNAYLRPLAHLLKCVSCVK